MKPLLAFVGFALVVACSLSLESPQARETKPKGTLIAVGGGGTTPQIIERALALAGGKSAPMLIVPQASSDPKAGEESQTFWKEHGATNVEVLTLGDTAAAAAAIRKAAFIWMPGGDQSRLIEALSVAGLVGVIAERFHAGAVVGGTSAGAAVLSKLMIVGGEQADLESVRAGGTVTVDGLGLSTELVFDQHFVKRRRFTRLLACVADHPATIGVGIDEKTAVIVTDGKLEVVGDSSVLVVDARGAKCAAKQPGELHSATGMKLHVLVSGDKLEYGPAKDD